MADSLRRTTGGCADTASPRRAQAAQVNIGRLISLMQSQESCAVVDYEHQIVVIITPLEIFVVSHRVESQFFGGLKKNGKMIAIIITIYKSDHAD